MDETRQGKRGRSKTTGPYAPPLPSEVDGDGPEPMAVAGDKEGWKDESFHPTTAPMDQWAPDVARRYRQHPAGPEREGTTASREENRAAEASEDVDERGFRHPPEE